MRSCPGSDIDPRAICHGLKHSLKTEAAFSVKKIKFVNLENYVCIFFSVSYYDYYMACIRTLNE